MLSSSLSGSGVAAERGVVANDRTAGAAVCKENISLEQLRLLTADRRTKEAAAEVIMVEG